MTNTSAEPTACRSMPRALWGGYGQGSPLSWSHPCPRGPSPCPLCSLPPPTSHPGTPNPTQISHPTGPPASGSHSWRCRGDPPCRWSGRRGRGALPTGTPAPAAAGGWHPPAAAPGARPGCRRSSGTAALPAERPSRLLRQPQPHRPQGWHPGAHACHPPRMCPGGRGERHPLQPHLSLPQALGDSHPMLVAHHVGPPLDGVRSELQEG